MKNSHKILSPICTVDNLVGLYIKGPAATILDTPEEIKSSHCFLSASLFFLSAHHYTDLYINKDVNRAIIIRILLQSLTKILSFLYILNREFFFFFPIYSEKYLEANSFVGREVTVT